MDDQVLVELIHGEALNLSESGCCNGTSSIADPAACTARKTSTKQLITNLKDEISALRVG